MTAPGVDDPAPAAAARPGGTSRRIGVTLAIAVGILAALTGLRWIDASRPEPLAALQSLIPWLVAPLVLVLACSVATRHWRVVIVATAVLCVHGALLAPWWIIDDPTVPVNGPPLTVMAANLQYGLGDAGTVVGAVRDHDVDVVVLIEATAGGQAALRSAGLDRLLPHVVGRTREDAGGMLIRSRHPFGDGGAPRVPALAFDTLVARVHAPGGDVLVLGAHPVPPWPLSTVRWHAEVAMLAGWAAQAPDDVPLVVAGDLNGTSDHPVIRRFTRAGMVNAHEVAGAGRPLTWSRDGGLIPPLLHLDHVLARDLHPVAAGTVDVAGSDHSAVWARLRRLAP
jgi:endonuclease/exonuclease/phosphatase (EEP) superfamily protein YafD